MSEASLEERVRCLEEEVVRLKELFQNGSGQQEQPWWDKIYGTFKDDPVYDEAMRLGREYRESQRPDYEMDDKA